MKKLLIQGLLIAGLSASFFTGCSVDSVGVSAPLERPVYARPASPRAGYVWVDGNWVRVNGRYQWREGYWSAPRRGRTAYVPGHWQQTGRGYQWRNGYWQ